MIYLEDLTRGVLIIARSNSRFKQAKSGWVGRIIQVTGDGIKVETVNPVVSKDYKGQEMDFYTTAFECFDVYTGRESDFEPKRVSSSVGEKNMSTSLLKKGANLLREALKTKEQKLDAKFEIRNVDGDLDIRNPLVLEQIEKLIAKPLYENLEKIEKELKKEKKNRCDDEDEG